MRDELVERLRAFDYNVDIPTFYDTDPECVSEAAAQIEADGQRIAALEAQLAEREPVAWMHTLHMEHGQTITKLSDEPYGAFGEPGRDYSREYTVTVTPLYRAMQEARDD